MPSDLNLLQALIVHASVALENSRLFTRITQSSRQWAEIFDSISDFIVVHDEHFEVLRVNRSLSEFIGVRPAELIGLSMRALGSIAADSPQPCPFCRGENESDEYLHPVLERTYLVSSSSIHGALDEGMQTVHVLKDITDRREAEQRYRELFDNIQEGIFFSTPQGRFIEVNDALVRILGYSSRHELLQVDIPNEIYFAPERRHELAAIIEREGGLRNHEEVLRRKDGSPVHVLINGFAMRNSQGAIQQYRGLLLDISGLRQSQTELQRERDFSGKILRHTQSLILVTDTLGVISYANRRWGGLGFELTQLLGHSFSELTVPARQGPLHDALAAVAGG